MYKQSVPGHTRLVHEIQKSCMSFRIVPPNYKGAESYVGDIGYVIMAT